MDLKLYQIDAFAEQVFEGNPAAVIPLQEWLSDELMQKIASENNLSETTFFVKEADHYHIRWFTPANEVDLCGHATLASAYVLFNILDYPDNTLTFKSRSGLLNVSRKDELLELDFPKAEQTRCEAPPELIKGLSKTPIETWKTDDYFVVFETEQDIIDLEPNFNQLAEADCRGIIVTAPGEHCDFVSRFFAPRYGINEDPVTGSAHCKLTPYWAEKLNKTELSAQQLSARGGKLRCTLTGDRVLIAGKAVKYMEGVVTLNDY